MFKPAASIVFGAWIAMGTALAGPADHYTPADLSAIMAGLKAKATTGSASDTLAKYPNHYTMLAYRTANGQGEVHAQYADIFVVVRGQATLITEGTLEGGHEESPGNGAAHRSAVAKQRRCTKAMSCIFRQERRISYWSPPATRFSTSW